MATLPSVGAKQLPLAAAPNELLPLNTTDVDREVIGLFEQFGGSTLRYVLAFGLSRPDAEEIVQDVFLALCKHMKHGKSCHNLRGWIFSVAHNLALKGRHSNRRSHQGSPVLAETIAKDELDSSPNPEEQVLVVERQRRLLAVLGVLPEQDRWCLHLRAEGLRYREIAEVLGMSLGAVSASLSRSLTRLMSADR